MLCPVCETPAPTGATKCGTCDAPLPSSCLGCGEPIAVGVDFCAACRTDPVLLAAALLDADEAGDEPEFLDDALDPMEEEPAASKGTASGELPSFPRASHPPSEREAGALAAGPEPATRPEPEPEPASLPSLSAAASGSWPSIPWPLPTWPAPSAVEPGVRRPTTAMSVDGDEAGAKNKAGAAGVLQKMLDSRKSLTARERPTRREQANAVVGSASAGISSVARSAPSDGPAIALPPEAATMSERPDAVDLSPGLVGREPTLGRLTALVEKAIKRSEVQLVALTGAPGIGKSLLARSLPIAVASVSPDALVLVGSCGGHGAPPFAALAHMLSELCGIADGDPITHAQIKITQLVARSLPTGRAAEVAHLIARLIGVPFVDGALAQEHSDHTLQFEARTLVAVRRVLGGEAVKRPLVLVFDDIERARPETVRLIRYLAAGLERLPVMLLIVGRPSLYDDHPSLTQSDAVLERIELGPLSPDESERLFAVMTRAAGDPPLALLRHARERLGGSPRAIVELVRYLLETGAIKKLGARYAFDRMRFARSALASASAPSLLPGSLDELLAARLGALEPARRELLEKAAACGETFWLDALVAISRAVSSSDPDGPSLEEIEVQGEGLRDQVAAALAELAESGLVAESPHSRITGEREFHFSYPPWRDVVYRTLSAQARRRYHKLVAQWLELRPEGRGDAEQEEVGLHLESAGDGDGAALRYRRAGDGARNRYYNDEAIRLYGRALACVGEGDLATRINLFHDLGSVHQLKGEHAPARRAFELMLRLSWMVASRSKAAVAWNKLGRLDRQQGILHRALSYLERGLALFDEVEDARGVAGSLDDAAQVLWLLGRYDEALARAAAALEQRRMLGDQRSIALSLLTIGQIERHRGLFREAEACYQEALAIRRGLDDRGGIAASLNGLGALSFQRGDFDGARALWEEALGLAEGVGALPLMAVLEGHLGEVSRAQGSSEEARVRFERSRAAAHDLDDKRLLSEALRNLAMLEVANAELQRARALAEQALELAEAAGIRVDVGRALIALGEIHAQTLFHDEGDGSEGADDYFRRAVELFREIGNAAELGVALERFGARHIERGDLEEGKALLAEAHDIFDRLGMKAYGDAAQRIITELD